MENFKMVAKTFFGFEEVLANELLKLGAQRVEKGTRMVSFYGDKGFMYKANLALRTALKILKPIKQFRVFNETSLYEGIQSIDWKDYLKVHQSFVIDATVFSEQFNHSQFVALKSKDAIVDQFKEMYDERPNIDKDHPDLRINIHIQKDVCTVSLDTSGASLHHRGYRTATNIAPINEVLAAGILIMSGWEGQTDFLDPMCGSGTFLVEAAMIACNIPANINRKEFHYDIIGYDKAPSAVAKAIDNARNANLDDYIKIEQKNFFETQKETERPLHIVFNPPYGERLDIDLERFYREIGDTLKQSYPGTQAWFITGNLEALKFVGLKPSRKIKLFNGKLESRLVKYEMYAGSKRTKFQNRERYE